MASSTTVQDPKGRLQRLQGFLKQDPDNPRLLADAADAAVRAGDTQTAGVLLKRFAAHAPLPPALLNLKGVIALAEGRHEEAFAIFEDLVEQTPDDAALRFNLAWSRAMGGDFEGAAQLIDDEVAAVSAAAAALHVEALHHLGRLDEALAHGRSHANRFPEDPHLLGSLAVAAADADRPDLALAYAERAGSGSADGLAATGSVRLIEHRLEEALSAFDAALVLEPGHVRARIGRGIALLGAGRMEAAATELGAVAGPMGDHAPTWLAAGWAALGTGDISAARSALERALAADDTFADTHASLGILDAATGDRARAADHVARALALDPGSASAALAQSLLHRLDGDIKAADQARSAAVELASFTGGAGLAQLLGRLRSRPREGA